jgi:hypothetical protein
VCRPYQEQSFDPETEEILENKTDSNCDKKFDEVITYQNNEPKRAEKDENGRRLRHFRRLRAGRCHQGQERDVDSTGRSTSGSEYAKASRARRKDDNNGDGKPDSRRLADGMADLLEQDRDFDGKPDSRTEFKDGAPALVIDDENEDGRPEIRAEFAANGKTRASRPTARALDVLIEFTAGKHRG